MSVHDELAESSLPVMVCWSCDVSGGRCSAEPGDAGVGWSMVPGGWRLMQRLAQKRGSGTDGCGRHGAGFVLCGWLWDVAC